MDAIEYIRSQMVVHFHRHRFAVLAHDAAMEAHELMAMARLAADLRALEFETLIPAPRRSEQSVEA